MERTEIDQTEDVGRYHYAIAGAVICFLLFGAMAVIFSRAAATDFGWAFAIGVGIFVGMWAGIGFGLMAGNAIYQSKHSTH